MSIGGKWCPDRKAVIVVTAGWERSVFFVLSSFGRRIKEKREGL